MRSRRRRRGKSLRDTSIDATRTRRSCAQRRANTSSSGSTSTCGCGQRVRGGVSASGSPPRLAARAHPGHTSATPPPDLWLGLGSMQPRPTARARTTARPPRSEARAARACCRPAAPQGPGCRAEAPRTGASAAASRRRPSGPTASPARRARRGRRLLGRMPVRSRISQPGGRQLAAFFAGVGRRGVGSGVCCRDAAVGRHGSGSGVCGQEVEREGVDVVEVGVVGREGGDPCGDWQVVPVPVRVDPAEEGLACRCTNGAVTTSKESPPPQRGGVASHREGNAPQHRAHPRSVRRLIAKQAGLRMSHSSVSRPRSVRRLQRVGRRGIQQ